MLFDCLFKALHTIRAGKALAGWKPTQGVVTARLDVLPPEAREMVHKLIHELFLWCPDMMQQGGALDEFGKVLFAHLLKDLEPMQADCGMENEVFRRLIAASSQLGTNLVQLEKWGALTQADCHSRNLSLANCGTVSSDAERAFRSLSESVAESKATVASVREENKGLREELAAVKGEVGQLEVSVQKLSGSLKSMVNCFEIVASRVANGSPPSSAGSGMKRRRLVEESVAGGFNLSELMAHAVDGNVDDVSNVSMPQTRNESNVPAVSTTTATGATAVSDFFQRKNNPGESVRWCRLLAQQWCRN